MTKTIHRADTTANQVFDQRSLETDYSTLLPVLRPGLRVLDVGCGTGAISKGIAERVGPTGHVTGIDNTETFIVSGRERYASTGNLELVHGDLFSYTPAAPFDLIVSARTFQWLSQPQAALQRLKTLLKPGGMLSVLDYNHEALEWTPLPPESMQRFYQAFLQWRAAAGMNNRVAEDLSGYFAAAGFASIEVHPADEVYEKGAANFQQRIGIWINVAGLTQIVEEGYASEALRLQAIADYTTWMGTAAERMVMKLKEVRGIVPGSE